MRRNVPFPRAGHICTFTHTCLYHTGNPGDDDRDNVLLVAVLVPVLSVLLLVALLVPAMVGGWRFWAKRCALILYLHPQTLLQSMRPCLGLEAIRTCTPQPYCTTRPVTSCAGPCACN